LLGYPKEDAMHATRIAAPGSTLYVEDHQGNGPSLVLLHGLTRNLRTWDSVVPALAKSFRVITLDLPGHGQSPSASDATLRTIVEDLAYVASHLGAENPAIWGHSVGGYAALLYATRHRARAVICEDSGWGAPFRAITDANIHKARTNPDLPSDLHRGLNANVVETMRQLPEVFQACPCPVHLIFAQPPGPNIHARRWTADLAANYPHIQVAWLDTPTQDLHAELPETMADLCSSFLRDTPGDDQASA
jgi:pimeloyl-ACP methyl ester carboxylesterase